MTDEELYEKARTYGRNALQWRYKFTGLLPEVERRKLYLKKGFSSIFEFSFKLAGLSEQQVRRVLSLGGKFTDTPALKALLEKGEVSVNKLARVASIANSENESELAQAVQTLSQSAVETLVRDEKEIKFVRTHKLELSTEVTEKLLELQEKGIDINELLTELLEKREEEILKEKVAIGKELKVTKSRYIPVKIRKLLRKEHGNKCSIQTCKKTAEQIHHTQTFALSRIHNPHYLAPLCKNHHIIAHAINIKVQEMRAGP